MEYKFVDIGTSYFCTSIDEFGLDVNGILVEPVEEYLNLIPSSPTIIKANYAISDSNRIDKMFVPISETPLRYISEKEIIEKELRISGRDGCSSLGRPHPDEQINYRTVECSVITLDELCKKYDITSIEYLKIDTEGHDHIILRQVFNMIMCGKLNITKQIMFEYNHLANKVALNELIDKFKEYLKFNNKLVYNIWGQYEMCLEKKRSR